MKNCDTCCNFIRVKTFKNKVGICSHTDHNISYMKGKPCKYYQKSVNNKRKTKIDLDYEIEINNQIEYNLFEMWIDINEAN